MASKRDQITMTPEEIQEFLESETILTIASIGPTGHPHLMPMWYTVIDGAPAFWTFAKSQKVLNLRRDPRISALVEAGERDYGQLRGVEFEGTANLIDDYDRVLAFGLAVGERYNGPAAVSDAARPFIEAQARKRILVTMNVQRIRSWDHRKLGGAY